MVDHQLGQLITINQNNFASDLGNIASSILGESGSCDENALGSLLRLKCSGKLHDVRPSNRSIVPSLGLNVDEVQPQFVFFDNSVDTPISTLAHGLSRVGARAAIAHFQEEIDDDPFEE